MSFKLATATLFAALVSPVYSVQPQVPLSTQTHESRDLVRQCIAPGVVCVHGAGANLPYPFYRDPPNGTSLNNYGDIAIPGDSTWDLVAGASFIVFDEERAKSILSSEPTVKFVFAVSPYLHESPVYVPGRNQLYFSELSTDLPQYVVDLSLEKPTPEPFMAEPAIWVPNGGFYHQGRIYYSVAGSNATVASTKSTSQQRPGIMTLDPATNKPETLLNNYFGLAFTDCDDLVVDPRTGYIWFTVPYYSWWLEVADLPPQMKSGTFRFDPQTGSVVIVDDDMRSPNGIAFNPDGTNLYIFDTAAAGYSAPISLDVPSPGIPGILFNATGKRTIYKFDVLDGGRTISNKRPIHYDTIDGVPDGLKVARMGW